MVKNGMREGIVPMFDLEAPPKKKIEASWTDFCCKKTVDDSEDDDLPKHLAHLKGKKVHIKMI